MEDRTCTVDGCDRRIKARGRCKPHWAKLRRRELIDSPPAPLRPTELADRLRRIGWTVTAAGCWEWNGWRNPKGYGGITIGNRSHIATRVAFEAWVGPIGELEVLHHCDNPPCINPAHLFKGTSADNGADMVDKDRSLRGERHHNHKLTAADVVEIRALAARGIRRLDIAEAFGVGRTTVQAIVSRTNWAWLE